MVVLAHQDLVGRHLQPGMQWVVGASGSALAQVQWRQCWVGVHSEGGGDWRQDHPLAQQVQARSHWGGAQ